MSIDTISAKKRRMNQVILGTAGVAALLLLFSGKASAKKGGGGPKLPPQCPPLPFISRTDVETLARERIAEGSKGLDKITAEVAFLMFPDEPWPKSAPWKLSGNAADHLVCAWDEIRKMISELGVPEEPKSPGKIIQDIIKSEPVPGNFYKIKKTDDSVSGILRKALNAAFPGGGESASARIEYLACITSGQAWNWPLYAATYLDKDEPRKSCDQGKLSTGKSGWSKAYATNGRMISRAFCPWHDDALAAVKDGRFPKRRITADGQRLQGGTHYGLLWLPPVSTEALEQGEVDCAPFEWEDGSSTLDPPPELLDLLEGEIQ